MPRCLPTVMAALALSVPLLVAAQVVRPIPTQSLRGEMVFGQPPEVLLNGQVVRLAPGARIKDPHNMLVLSGALVGQKVIANYTADPYGLLMDVWVLNERELAKPWPKTPEEAATWVYDLVSQTWIKP